MTDPSLPKTLQEAARDGRLIPFVGAGVSMAVRRTDGTRLFPSWPELLAASAERLEEEGHAAYSRLIRAMLDMPKPDYFEVAKQASDGLGAATWRRFLVERLAPSRDKIANDSLALAEAIWKLGSNVVITTNYDRVLSWACPWSDDLWQWSIESASGLTDLLGGRLDRPCIWQLHGSINDPTQLILTPDGYRKLYGDASQQSRYQAALTGLRSLMAGNHLLFVGFSLDDEYVARQLDWVHEVFGGGDGPHYVLVRAAELTRMREKLVGTGIQPITFDDFGEPLLRLLAEITAVATVASAPENSAQLRTEDEQVPVRCPAEASDGAQVTRAEKLNSGPLSFLLKALGDLLILVVVALWQGVPAVAWVTVLILNTIISIFALNSLGEPVFGTAAIVYVVVSILLVAPLTIRAMLESRTEDEDEESELGALMTILQYFVAVLAAIFCPCFLIGRWMSRAVQPRTILNYIEIVLLSALFFYWGHLAWQGLSDQRFADAPLLATTIYVSPVAAFLLGKYSSFLGSPEEADDPDPPPP